MNRLTFRQTPFISAHNAGLFVSRGQGQHPERIMHSHELILVEEGALGMFEENREFIVNKGESLILFPGRKHGGTMTYPPDLKFFWLHFDVRQTSEKSKKELICLNQHTRLPEPERMTFFSRRFLAEQESGRNSQNYRTCLLQLMLNDIAESTSAEEVTQEIFVLAQKVEQIIITRFTEHLGTSEIAAELRYSPDHLARVYRQAFGITVTEALHKRRIALAKKLLLSESYNINETGLKCGFNDPAQFRKIFRRHEGVSPGAFRRLFARGHLNTQ